ncbi:GNAT family N-acetyltransferase [Paenibacillus pasadenensis]|uniref:GNAT family N-acetyltransferase n=1 Tax=Paenibacillus pasadenensis TaxID=217090 RepID=UPI002040CDDB|nr:GNAT family protein [Paenibacillus pasadenensis]MCM3746086.1 GNAT family N-acetyltransferase [Paenibacillus pasadenensis]
MNVTTERLIIRRFNYEDWPAVLEYTSNQTVMNYIPEGIQDEAAVKRFVEKNIGDEAGNFPVVLKDDGTLIGHIVFHRYFGEHTFEIGWVFNPRFYHRGYASEAALAIQPENVPSHRLMEKIGMRREGHFQKCIPHGDEWWDEYYYAILREEWNSREAKE